MRHADSKFLFLLVVVVLLGGYPSRAQSADQEVIIKPVDNKVLFDTEEITAKAGSRLRVVFDNLQLSWTLRHDAGGTPLGRVIGLTSLSQMEHEPKSVFTTGNLS